MLFTDFLDHILPSVAGCPDQVVIDHTIKAARIYCARTLCMSYETAATLTVAGQSIYPVDVDDSQERVRMLKAWVGGVETKVVDVQNGRNLVRAQSGQAFVYMENALDLVVYPAPSVGSVVMTNKSASVVRLS